MKIVWFILIFADLIYADAACSNPSLWVDDQFLDKSPSCLLSLFNANRFSAIDVKGS